MVSAPEFPLDRPGMDADRVEMSSGFFHVNPLKVLTMHMYSPLHDMRDKVEGNVPLDRGRSPGHASGPRFSYGPHGSQPGHSIECYIQPETARDPVMGIGLRKSAVATRILFFPEIRLPGKGILWVFLLPYHRLSDCTGPCRDILPGFLCFHPISHPHLSTVTTISLMARAYARPAHSALILNT